LTKARTLRTFGVLGALGALTVVGAGAGGATASTSDKAGATVITMERDGKELFFDYPDTVAAGTTLKIKNKTDVAEVGPHTFSIVREKDLPTKPKDIKACGKRLEAICGAIAEWHEVNLETGEVGENPVEVGKEGWDRKGSLKRKGDSWYTETEGEKFAREVTAPAGKELSFICAVHAEMQGTISVVEG
jgi:plastocyanin